MTITINSSNTFTNTVETDLCTTKTLYKVSESLIQQYEGLVFEYKMLQSDLERLESSEDYYTGDCPFFNEYYDETMFKFTSISYNVSALGHLLLEQGEVIMVDNDPF